MYRPCSHLPGFTLNILFNPLGLLMSDTIGRQPRGRLTVQEADNPKLPNNVIKTCANNKGVVALSTRNERQSGTRPVPWKSLWSVNRALIEEMSGDSCRKHGGHIRIQRICATPWLAPLVFDHE